MHISANQRVMLLALNKMLEYELQCAWFVACCMKHVAKTASLICAAIKHAAKSIQETFLTILELRTKLIIAERSTQPAASRWDVDP